MSYPTSESQEMELGRIGGLGIGRVIGLELVFTNKKIVQIDRRAETLPSWAGTILGIAVWFLVSPSLVNFLFTLLREIVVVVGFVLLPVFMVLIPRYLAIKPKPKISSISREVIARVIFEKPGITTPWGTFRVELANDRLFVFWAPGESKFEEASSAIQRFCNYPPTIPFVEATSRQPLKEGS